MARVVQARKSRTTSKRGGEKRRFFDVQEFYDLGCKARERRDSKPPKKSYAEVQRKLAAEVGTNYEMVRKAERFAKLYDREALARLLALRRPDGTSLRFDHVRRLILVRNKRERERFQRRAAAKGWAGERLAREIARWKGEERGGGRRLRQPSTAAEGLDQVAEYTRRWLSHYDELWSGQPPWLKRVNANADMRRRLRKVIDSLRLLAEDAGKLAKSLETAPKRAGRKKSRRPSAK